MQPFTLSIGAWLRRLTTRNLLVRRSDRIEAVALLVVLATEILAAPVAGAVGTAVRQGVHRGSVQQGYGAGDGDARQLEGRLAV